MFITIEDETGIANLVVWVKLIEKYRPIVLSASVMAIKRKIQREGEVVHLVAKQTPLLLRAAERCLEASRLLCGTLDEPLTIGYIIPDFRSVVFST